MSDHKNSPAQEELIARQNIAVVYSVAIVLSSFCFGIFGCLAWVFG